MSIEAPEALQFQRFGIKNPIAFIAMRFVFNSMSTTLKDTYIVLITIFCCIIQEECKLHSALLCICNYFLNRNPDRPVHHVTCAVSFIELLTKGGGGGPSILAFVYIANKPPPLDPLLFSPATRLTSPATIRLTSPTIMPDSPTTRLIPCHLL